MQLFPDLDGGEQGAHTDSRSAEVVYLVDLKAGIDLIGAGQNIIHLVGCHGIKTAAEGIQLDQIEIFNLLDIACSRVQTRMVHPLVGNDQRAFGMTEVGDGVLRQDCHIEGGNQLGNTVVDLRIGMIGMSCQHDAAFSGLCQIVKRLLTLFLDVLSGVGKLFPCSLCRGADLTGRQLGKFPEQRLCHGVDVAEGHEGIPQLHLTARDFLHVVLDIFRVGGNNGTVVMVVCTLYLVALVEQGGIENEIDTLINQPCDMTVGELCRITLRLAGNGLYAELVNFTVGAGGEHDAVAQPCEERVPERIVLVHVQHSGNADCASRRLCRVERGIGEEPLQLVLKQVGDIVCVLLSTDAALAAVARDKLASSGKTVDGETAAVRAALTFCHACFILQIAELLVGEHCAFLPVLVMLSGDQCRSERTHDAGDVGADRLAVRDLLKASQNGIIVERAALNDNIFAQLGGIGYLDYLEKGILDNGVCETGGNVGNARTLLLCLFYLGVHENCTARSKIDRMLGEQCRLCEVLHAVVQRFGEGLDEGAAAGGAGFIQLHAVHGLVLDLDALHILTADVENTVHGGIEERGGIVVRNGFHLAVVQQKSSLHESFTVACGAGADDMYILRELLVNFLQGADRRL